MSYILLIGGAYYLAFAVGEVTALQEGTWVGYIAAITGFHSRVKDKLK